VGLSIDIIADLLLTSISRYIDYSTESMLIVKESENTMSQMLQCPPLVDAVKELSRLHRLAITPPT